MFVNNDQYFWIYATFLSKLRHIKNQFETCCYNAITLGIMIDMYL